MFSGWIYVDDFLTKCLLNVLTMAETLATFKKDFIVSVIVLCDSLNDQLA
jgi:hypothetical protein